MSIETVKQNSNSTDFTFGVTSAHSVLTILCFCELKELHISQITRKIKSAFQEMLSLLNKVQVFRFCARTQSLSRFVILK